MKNYSVGIELNMHTQLSRGTRCSFWVSVLLQFHSLCMLAVKTLTRLLICTDLAEYGLLPLQYVKFQELTYLCIPFVKAFL